MRTLLLAISMAVLGIAIHVRDGLYSQVAIALLAAAFAFCAIGVLAPIGGVSYRVAQVVLVTLIVSQLIAMLFKPAGASTDTVPYADPTPFRVGLATALVGTCMIALGARRSGFALILLSFAVTGVWKIRAAPQPKIDVFVFQTDAPKALARGVNPYTITFPNVYGDDTTVYGPGIVRDGRLLFGYPYPPLILLFTTPAQWLAGDFRYAQLLAMLATAIFW